ncbi:hypothetical protein FACS1894170_09540 [Planctomycetales bacterium]|nr:hypothetical protein FACS1894170_09540 [Planctomycetales bacterium]
MGLRQDFEAALQQLKTELISDLNHTDVLKKDKLVALHTLYNQKLVNVQVQFLKMLSSSTSQAKVEFTKPNTSNLSDYGKIVLGGLGAGGTTAAALTFITFGVPQIATATSWFIFTTTTTTTTTVTLAAWLAATLGISATLAVSILTGGIGIIAAGVMYFTYYPVWRRRIRKKLLEDFDSKILPVLRDWADAVIQTAEAR